MSFSVERRSAYDEIYNDEIFDEDGRPKRTGKKRLCVNGRQRSSVCHECEHFSVQTLSLSK